MSNLSSRRERISFRMYTGSDAWIGYEAQDRGARRSRRLDLFLRFIEGFCSWRKKTFWESAPKQCPDLHGLHFHRFTSTIHHHQTKLVSIFWQPAELRYKKYGLPKSHQEDIWRPTQACENHQTSFFLNGETKARKGEKNNRNDTSWEGLEMYHLLPLRP